MTTLGRPLWAPHPKGFGRLPPREGPKRWSQTILPEFLRIVFFSFASQETRTKFIFNKSSNEHIVLSRPTWVGLGVGPWSNVTRFWEGVSRFGTG